MADAKHILDLVRTSTEFVRSHAKDVKVNSSAIRKFLTNLSPEEWRSLTQVQGFPLKFPNIQAEINFHCIVDLLNFGSGYRHLLHEANGRGAYETICFGAMSMHLQGCNFDASYLASLSLVDVANFFDLPLTVEKQISGALYRSTDTALRPLAERIHKVITESGAKLRDYGYRDFAQFVIQASRGTGGAPPSAVRLVDALVKAFPAFADTATYDGTEVYLLKKAQLLAGDLYRHFRERDPATFHYADIERLTVFSDNVLPAVLRKLGILELSDSLAATIDARKELPACSREEVELRAVSVAACEEIARLSREGESAVGAISPLQLDYYLWTKGKDPQFRAVERHYTKDTVFY